MGSGEVELRATGQIVLGDPKQPIGIITLHRVKRWNANSQQAVLGFDFPRSAPINRREINQRIIDGVPRRNP